MEAVDEAGRKYVEEIAHHERAINSSRHFTGIEDCGVSHAACMCMRGRHGRRDSGDHKGGPEEETEVNS